MLIHHFLVFLNVYLTFAQESTKPINEEGYQFEKFKIDTDILYKINKNESLQSNITAGIKNDFVYKIKKTTLNENDMTTTTEFNLDGSKYEEYEGVMAQLAITYRDKTYRRRWNDLILLGFDELVKIISRTTDPTFYLKDIHNIGHTIQGEKMWKKVQLFVRNWNGIEDYYKLTALVDQLPDEQFFQDVNEGRKLVSMSPSPVTNIIRPMGGMENY